MNSNIYSIPINDLIHLIENDKIDLKPSYQRNLVWSKKDQESLIDSIESNFPLPNFFFFRKSNGLLEMVDGQQRARAIYSFYKGLITDSEKRYIQDINKEHFLNYKINITEITDVFTEDVIRKFYVLVNQKGVQLNKPEINKAEFAVTKFLSLVEELLENPLFSNLELFTDAISKRMNDRSYVEELVAYLLLGITDKKIAVEKIYETDIDKEQYEKLKKIFENILDRLSFLNAHKEINKSRYKQRNDFYTLFNFINDGLGVDNRDVLLYQYRILLMIEQYISPSNDQCKSFQNYAFNCITQSNSKKARIERLIFFNQILRNKNIEENSTIQEVSNFLIDTHDIKKFKQINEYLLFDLDND